MSFLAALQEAIKDRYRVEEELGRGAMAIVFRGHDLRHNRAVAIKLLRPELSDVVGSERFLREIQVAARLQHSHIVPLFDSGASRGFVYLVMPLLTGESLRARLDGEGPLHADEALRLTLQVGDALQYAHRKGVIHRDVKPENILLHEGNALIADFGVALALTGGEDQRITAAGLVVGTPAYMSPEQATGAAVDGRSDLYSLGCVLYEMLTDELPHGGITTPEVIARKLTELPRSVRDLRKNTPVHVAAAVERALARLAADRFDSVGEFVQALKGHGPARKAPRLRLRFPTSAIGLMVIAAVFGGYAWITRTRATERKPLDPLLVTASPLGTDGQHGLESVGLALLELVDGQLPGPPGLRLSLVTSRGRGLWGDSARFGPGRRLTGTLREGPDGLTVRFELEDLIRVRSLGQATATGPRDSLAALARVLAVKLLQLETARGDPAALAVLPRSLLALSALNSGIGYYRLARYQSAVESFNSAIEADSTLAIAGLWLIMAGRRYGSGPLGMQEYAWTHRGGLAPRDQAVLRGFLGSRFPISFTHREWLENLEAAVAAAPDRPELWFELGDFLKWNGAYLGLPDALERAEGALLQALRYDPEFTAALVALMEVRGRRGDRAGLKRSAEQFLAADPRGELAPYVRWRLALAERDSLTRGSLVSHMVDWSGMSLVQLVWETQYNGLPPQDALAATDALLQRGVVADVRWNMGIIRHDLFANIGRPREAASVLVADREANPQESRWRSKSILDALFWEGDTALAKEALDSLKPSLGSPPSPDSVLRSRQIQAHCWYGVWYAWRGNPGSAREALRWLEGVRQDGPSSTIPSRPSCAYVLRTMLTVGSGSPDGAERVDSLEQIVLDGGPIGPFSNASNLVLSTLHERLGNPSRARLAASRLWYIGTTLYVSPYFLRSGQLALLDGDSIAARTYLSRVASLWAAGDSAHRARSDSLKRILAQLP